MSHPTRMLTMDITKVFIL